MHQRHRRQTDRQTTDGIAIAYSKRNVIRWRLLKKSGDYSGRKGRDGQKKKRGKANEKRKKGTSKKEQKMMKWMDERGKKAGKGYPSPTLGTEKSPIVKEIGNKKWPTKLDVSTSGNQRSATKRLAAMMLPKAKRKQHKKRVDKTQIDAVAAVRMHTIQCRMCEELYWSAVNVADTPYLTTITDSQKDCSWLL